MIRGRQFCPGLCILLFLYSSASFALQYQECNGLYALPRINASTLPSSSGRTTSFQTLEIPPVPVLEIIIPHQQSPWRSPLNLAQREWRTQPKIFNSVCRAFFFPFTIAIKCERVSECTESSSQVLDTSKPGTEFIELLDLWLRVL